jgi:hypothetical protein
MSSGSKACGKAGPRPDPECLCSAHLTSPVPADESPRGQCACRRGQCPVWLEQMVWPHQRLMRHATISQRPNSVLDAVGDLANLLLVDNKRRRQDQRIAKGANKDPVFKTMVRHGPRPLTGSIWRSFDLHGPKQAEVANIANHAAGAPDVVNGGFPFSGDTRDLLEDAFLRVRPHGAGRVPGLKSRASLEVKSSWPALSARSVSSR